MRLRHSATVAAAAVVAVALAAPGSAGGDSAEATEAGTGSAQHAARTAPSAGIRTVAFERELESNNDPKCNWDRIKSEKLKCTARTYNGPDKLSEWGRKVRDQAKKRASGCAAGVAAGEAGDRVDEKFTKNKRLKGRGQAISRAVDCVGGMF